MALNLVDPDWSARSKTALLFGLRLSIFTCLHMVSCQAIYDVKLTGTYLGHVLHIGRLMTAEGIFAGSFRILSYRLISR